MAKSLFVLILTLVISVLVSVAAFAATEPDEKPEPKAKPAPVSKPAPVGALGGFSLTPTVSGYSFAKPEQLNPALMYGLKVGYDKIGSSLEDSLGVEATFNYFSAKSKSVVDKTTGYLIRLDAIYPFVQGVKWMPFLAVGAGGIAIDTGTDSEKKPLINYGIGLKYFFENYLAVRIDGRHLMVYNTSSYPRNNFEIGVGVSYYFGKERKKKPAPPPITKLKVKDDPSKEKKTSETILETAPATQVPGQVPALKPVQEKVPEAKPGQ